METDERDFQTMMKHIESLHKENRTLTEKLKLKEYLSLKELVQHIPYKAQTIYNWISDGTWEMGIHYLKPTPRKLIFHWPTIKRWLEGQNIGKGHKSPHQRAARDVVL